MPGAAGPPFTVLAIHACRELTSARASALPSCSSYLMTLVPAGASTLTLSYWPATTDVSKAAAVSASSQVRRPASSSLGAELG